MSAQPNGSPDGRVTVQRLEWDEAARSLWHAVRTQHGQGNALSEPAWFDILARAYRPTLALFAALDASGTARGVAPTYTVRDIRGGKHLYCLRHGLVAGDADTAGALCAAVAGHCRTAGVASALLTSGTADPGLVGRRISRTSLTLPLPADPQFLWSSFRNKVRNTIRKAERSDVEFAESSAQIDDFWRLSADAMSAQSLPVKSRRFFRAIVDRFGADARLYTARLDGRVVGGMLVVTNASTASYAYGAFDPDGRRLGINSALMWKVCEDLIGAGYTTLDLGESTVDGGTYKFKQRLGGVDETIFYVDPLRPSDTASGAPAAGQDQRVQPPGRFLALTARLPKPARRAALTWLGGHGRIV